ncbi:GtrA family protein [Allosaccharopolyspora coralli]|uniref:GtrA family protein n=1 Tax=Allosaccharopolyspora coralli TaxID=2665642 RepID=A0A5Q3Q2B1_9PSEU|nr:GtrA family protein [Allosaccharopolyspora coralli]
MRTVDEGVSPRTLSLRQQLVRFVLIGSTCAVIDAGTYSIFLAAGAPSFGSKTAGFILGTTASYLVNRRFTFNSDSNGHSVMTVALFAAVYLATLAVNVGSNELLLGVLPTVPITDGELVRYALSWVIAQALSTILNFILLRTVVFRH